MGLATAFSISQTTEGKQNAQQECIALVHPTKYWGPLS